VIDFKETSSGVSAFEIMRNYENAIKKAGAKIIFSDPGGSSASHGLIAKLVKDNLFLTF